MKNARFWTFINDGFVKITLRPNQTLHWANGGWHDEGWFSNYRRWTHCGDVIEREDTSDGTDCDGRLTRGTNLVCHIDNLHSRNCGIDNSPMLPDWELEDKFYRDYSAEAMGY